MCRSESKQGQAPNKRVREITADSNDDFVIDAVYGVENKLLLLSTYCMVKFV